MLFAQDVLRLHEDVEAVGADEADDGHVDDTAQPATVMECLMHG